MARQLLQVRSMRQFTSEDTEKLQSEFNEEICKPFSRKKEEEDLSRIAKELNDFRRMEEARRHAFDCVQRTNKELVAKLEQVEKEKKSAIESNTAISQTLHKERKKANTANKELAAKLEEVKKDRNFAVESRIELTKILDEERKKVSCLEEKCVNLEKGIESQKTEYMEREITYKSKILEEEEKVEVEREKNRVLQEEVDNYKSLVEENDLIVRREDGWGNIIKFESGENKDGKELVKADAGNLEKMRKLLSEHMKKMKRMKKIKAAGVKHKLETRIPVDANTNDCQESQDTLFGCEDDTVYVDFDGFEVVGNF